MTFNEGARLDPSRVQRRGRAAGAGGMAIGGGIGGIVILLISMFLGVDLSSLGLGGSPTGSQVEPADPNLQNNFEEGCQTGADANANVDCRVAAAINSLDAYWEQQLPTVGVQLEYPGVVVFDGVAQSACGTASSQTGPFYCPPDQTIYIDTSFFALLQSEYGASGGPLAEMYVIAHEYGHHIENQLGVFDVAERGGSGANSDSVKVEIMADCLAGLWAGDAATVPDATGTPFLKPFTREDLNDALSAAAAVGDDHIQETTQGRANPETYTHGTSQQRQDAFVLGYETNSVRSCDAFGVTQ